MTDGDQRCSACSAKRLNRDQISEIARFNSSKDFICKRQKLTFNLFIDLPPLKLRPYDAI